MAWLDGEPQTLQERRRMLAGWQRDWLRGGDVLLGMFVGDRVAGSCGLHRRRGPDVLEIGYWTHPAFTRRGLATTAARLLTGAAFSLPGIARVEIHHDEANAASAGVPRRLGFVLAGKTPDEAAAPAEVGIDWCWQMDRAGWRARSR
jgi:RimJ/RimL family protein N-acetyltransferase